MQKRPSGSRNESSETKSTNDDSLEAASSALSMNLAQRTACLKFNERIAREVLILCAVSQDYDVLKNLNKKSTEGGENVLKLENFGKICNQFPSAIKQSFRAEVASCAISAMPFSGCPYRPVVLGVPDCRGDCWNCSMSAIQVVAMAQRM